MDLVEVEGEATYVEGVVLVRDVGSLGDGQEGEVLEEVGSSDDLQAGLVMRKAILTFDIILFSV